MNKTSNVNLKYFCYIELELGKNSVAKLKLTFLTYDFSSITSVFLQDWVKIVLSILIVGIFIGIGTELKILIL